MQSFYTFNKYVLYAFIHNVNFLIVIHWLNLQLWYNKNIEAVNFASILSATFKRKNYLKFHSKLTNLRQLSILIIFNAKNLDANVVKKNLSQFFLTIQSLLHEVFENHQWRR